MQSIFVVVVVVVVVEQFIYVYILKNDPCGVKFFTSLRKPAYSNILKILQTQTGNISDKKF